MTTSNNPGIMFRSNQAASNGNVSFGNTGSRAPGVHVQVNHLRYDLLLPVTRRLFDTECSLVIFFSLQMDTFTVAEDSSDYTKNKVDPESLEARSHAF